jgi:hypothetical protein
MFINLKNSKTSDLRKAKSQLTRNRQCIVVYGWGIPRGEETKTNIRFHGFVSINPHLHQKQKSYNYYIQKMTEHGFVKSPCKYNFVNKCWH